MRVAGSEHRSAHARLKSLVSLCTFARTPRCALALALLMTLSRASALEGACMNTRPPERDLWIEVVSCSEQVLREVSNELFVQAVGRTDQDWTRNAVPRATGLLREKPGVLIVARELAFADSALPFYSREGECRPKPVTPIGRASGGVLAPDSSGASSWDRPSRLAKSSSNPEGRSCERSPIAATPGEGRNWPAFSRCPSSC